MEHPIDGTTIVNDNVNDAGTVSENISTETSTESSSDASELPDTNPSNDGGAIDSTNTNDTNL